MKTYENTVLISGQVDSSLERSIGISVQELDRFKRALGEISNIAGSANAKANALVEPEGFKQAAPHAKDLESSFSNMHGFMHGIFVGTPFSRIHYILTAHV